MHRTLTAACLAAAAALTLTACDPATGDGKSTAPAVSTTTASPAAAITTDPAGTLPSLVGRPLPAARDAARTAGFTDVTSHDATGANRPQTTEVDWKVCFQQPGAGAADLATPVGLAVVLTAESCPKADGIAAPTPTPTPTPTPAPTTTKPKPKATATHQSNGTTGGSSSGGSSSGGTSGGSGHTEPPVDDHGGATALCNDGTLSFAAHHQGACSHHHGVAVFYK